MHKVERLAAFAAGARYEELAPEVIEQARVRLVDSLAVALAARPYDVPQKVRRFALASAGAPGEGPGALERLGPNLRALYYSALVRYLDFNDSYLAPGETFHPSDVIGGLLAFGDRADASGRELLLALALSYEVQARLSEAAPVRARGFDHTVQLSYAAAAAMGRLAGLDASRLAHAVAISGTAHNALRVTRTGALSHWKGLAAPYAVFGAANAVMLAAEGVTGPAEVFEGNKGFEQAIAGACEADWADPALRALPRSILKRYNAEVHSQSAIEAMLALRAGAGIDPAAVERIELDVFDVAYHIIGGGAEGEKETIRTKEEADHSLAYMVAVALLDGRVLPEQYRAERIARDDVQQLRRRVHIRPVDEYSRRFPEQMPVALRLYGREGLLAEREQSAYPGFHSQPMSLAGVGDKLRTLTAGLAGAPEPEAVLAAVERLEAEGVRALMRRLAL